MERPKHMVTMKNNEPSGGLATILSRSYLIFFILMLAACLVIFLPDTLPIYDYPNHIARLYILQLNGTDPLIAEHIVINWHYVTNLALEIVTYPLLRLFEPDTVGRIFICLSFLTTASGTIFLHRALGGKGPWPYIVFLFIFNDILLYGFLSYIFSIGLVLWAFAFWVKAEGMGLINMLIIFMLISLALLTFHLFAFGIYAMLVGTWEISAAMKRYEKKERLFSDNLIVGALQFIPSLAVFFLISETFSQTLITASSVSEKLSGIASIISFYTIKGQMIFVTLFGLGLLLLWKNKIVNLKLGMHVFMLLGGIVFLVAPMSAFNAYFLDFRMPVALLLPVLAAVQLKMTKDKQIYLWSVIITLCLAQYIYISLQWSKFDKVYDDMSAVTQTLKAGDRLIHIAIGRGRFSENLAPPLIHAPAYLVVSKRIITPFLFADVRHQPISYIGTNNVPQKITPLIHSQHQVKLDVLKKALADTLAANFDYVLLANFERSYMENSKHWQLISERGIFKLYKNLEWKNKFKN